MVESCSINGFSSILSCFNMNSSYRKSKQTATISNRSLLCLLFVFILLFTDNSSTRVTCYSEEEINEAVEEQILTYGSLLRIQNVMTKYM